ncbi:MAG: SCO family protein [Acidobacteriota bacterium]|nr:SCO family protein [Acidobacteriota bacterium]
MFTLQRFAPFIRPRERRVLSQLPKAAAGGLLCGMLLLSVAPAASGRQHSHAQHGTPRQGSPPHASERSAAERREAARKFLPDVELRDQDGRRVRFYSDLVKNRLVVINFVYTACTSMCPLQAQTFSRLQTHLGGRVGKDVFLISISADPHNDTPRRLKEWGTKFEVGPGWTLLTGEEATIKELLAALKGDTSARGMHTPVIQIYNDARGMWARAYGLAPPDELTQLIEAVAAEP